MLAHSGSHKYRRGTGVAGPNLAKIANGEKVSTAIISTAAEAAWAHAKFAPQFYDRAGEPADVRWVDRIAGTIVKDGTIHRAEQCRHTCDRQA